MIRLRWDLLPMVAFPFLRGPSSKSKQSASADAAAFFVPLHPLQEQALNGLYQHKKSATKLVALCFGFVIRLETENINRCKCGEM